jgi:DNA (cytosine-5)-methyltransferase 1
MRTVANGKIIQYPAKKSGRILHANEPGTQPLRVLDLFAGAGGISEGFRQAGYQIIGGTDLDPDACATFSLNFPDADCVCGDIRDEGVHAQIAGIAAKADVIVGGPPCQAFSQVRNHVRLIDDPRNSLYREFVNVVKGANPIAFVMENVTGMDQMGARDQITDDLSLDGEYCVSPQVLDAADFGVPQTRKRLLFIGLHRSLRCGPPDIRGSDATQSITLVRFPNVRRNRYQVVVQQSIVSQYLLNALGDPEDARVVTAEQAISDLEGLQVGNREDELSYNAILPPQSAYQRMMRGDASARLGNVQVPRLNADTEMRLRAIPPGGNHRDLADELLDRYLTGQRWGQDNGSGRLSRRHFYAYRRLHPSIWAWTLNTKGDSVYHYKKPRALSVREFARLQSFPDRFCFTTDARRGALVGRHDGGPAHSRYRQAGNAVPPLLARAIAQTLKEVVAAASGNRRLAIASA